MKAVKPKRIILAVDLKAEDPTLTERLWKAVKPLLEKDSVVEPVTILNREDAALAVSLKNRIGGIRAATENHLAQHLAKMGLKNLAAPKVLFADGSSTQRAVLALLSHAKKTGCDLIAVSSHSRKGIRRFFLGSFAESLSLQSAIPLLVVNPGQRDTEKAKTILFPTDFSEESRLGLESVCRFFQGYRPKIVLFHAYMYPVQMYVEPFASFQLPQSFVDADFKAKEKSGKEWCAELRKKGVACEFLIDRKAGFVVDGVLSAIRKKNIGIVAVVSRTGKAGTILLGSATREILRHSPRPVWVIHPAKETQLSVKKGTEKSAPAARRVVGWR